MPVRDFRDLEVRQMSVELAGAVYQLTKRFPEDERFGLSGQLRGAAISVSSNIAEGNGRGTAKDYIRFLMTSKGSLNEVRSLLAVATRLEFSPEEEIRPVELMAERVSRMLMGLRSSLAKRISR